MKTRNHKGVTSALPVFWERIRYLVERKSSDGGNRNEVSLPSQLSLSGKHWSERRPGRARRTLTSQQTRGGRTVHYRAYTVHILCLTVKWTLTTGITFVQACLRVEPHPFPPLLDSNLNIPCARAWNTPLALLPRSTLAFSPFPRPLSAPFAIARRIRRARC
ncbi:hypothetical protein EVAR_58476_1 [Eumeta japonica]|uniref:Uncharacterized protein n=1 Tax=Eumeta variegata TaxID=151549 RepID=A0A4C1YPD5_EUMVA|nr:hypothetical protein EVAR_58476_1 [Eumeta japonica]